MLRFQYRYKGKTELMENDNSLGLLQMEKPKQQKRLLVFYERKMEFCFSLVGKW
jgi:hypothetical protein